MDYIAGIIAMINPQQRDSLVAGMVVLGIVLLATFARDLIRRFRRAR